MCKLLNKIETVSKTQSTEAKKVTIFSCKDGSTRSETKIENFRWNTGKFTFRRNRFLFSDKKEGFKRWKNDLHTLNSSYRYYCGIAKHNL